MRSKRRGVPRRPGAGRTGAAWLSSVGQTSPAPCRLFGRGRRLDVAGRTQFLDDLFDRAARNSEVGGDPLRRLAPAPSLAHLRAPLVARPRPVDPLETALALHALRMIIARRAVKRVPPRDRRGGSLRL